MTPRRFRPPRWRSPPPRPPPSSQPTASPPPAPTRPWRAPGWRAHALPPSIRCRTPEGFAFYALAPQAVAAAAAQVPWELPPLVIGIRSIGTALAAVVAARLGVEALTVRPVGHPL
ncbi:MAG TPA: hypothetical protein VM422_02410, partial [Amaricoccus sp.]|nr:hypothetical protein [Amaricoccus sp.]